MITMKYSGYCYLKCFGMFAVGRKYKYLPTNYYDFTGLVSFELLQMKYSLSLI
jgi:hypothetical protein